MNPTQDSARSGNPSRVHDTLRRLVRRFRGEANAKNAVTRLHVHPFKRAALLNAARELDESAHALALALTDIVLRLSIHPAGCTKWRYYEQLCLDCADDLDEIVKQIERPTRRVLPSRGAKAKCRVIACGGAPSTPNE